MKLTLQSSRDWTDLSFSELSVVSDYAGLWVLELRLILVPETRSWEEVMYILSTNSSMGMKPGTIIVLPECCGMLYLRNISTMVQVLIFFGYCQKGMVQPTFWTIFLLNLITLFQTVEQWKRRIECHHAIRCPSWVLWTELCCHPTNMLKPWLPVLQNVTILGDKTIIIWARGPRWWHACL